MGRGLGDRQRRLLDWMQSRIEALAAGEIHDTGDALYVAPEGAQVQDLGVPWRRLANAHCGPDATAAELEATRRAVRTLQDRNLIAETDVMLGVVWLGYAKSEDLPAELERARTSPTSQTAFILQPEGAEPVPRWRRPQETIGRVYRDAILAHVTGRPLPWFALEPAMLRTVEDLAVERFGEGARWLAKDRRRLVEARHRMEIRNRLVVDRSAGDRWNECNVYLPDV